MNEFKYTSRFYLLVKILLIYLLVYLYFLNGMHFEGNPDVITKLFSLLM